MSDDLGRLYDDHAAALFRAAFRLLGRAADAEDAVQDVFVAVARRNLARLTNPRAYLFAALRNALTKRRRSFLPLPEDVPATPPAAADEALILALAKLPAEQREVVVLKVESGLTFAELADVMGVSANTAASRYRYALEKLRADLGGEP